MGNAYRGEGQTFASGVGGGGVAVKDSGEKPILPPGGAFVVVVVVVADKEHGGNEGDWRGQGRHTGEMDAGRRYAVVKMRRVVLMEQTLITV